MEINTGIKVIKLIGTYNGQELREKILCLLEQDKTFKRAVREKLKECYNTQLLNLQIKYKTFTEYYNMVKNDYVKGFIETYIDILTKELEKQNNVMNFN